MVFNTYNFDQIRILDFTSNEGVEVRKIRTIDEDNDDISMVEMTLSFRENYNVNMFFKRLEEDFNLKSVRSGKDKEELF